METNYIEIVVKPNGTSLAYIKGTRIRVQDIVMDYEIQGMSVDEIALNPPHITLAQIHAALSFYFDHRDEIQQQIKNDEQYVEMVRNVVFV